MGKDLAEITLTVILRIPTAPLGILGEINVCLDFSSLRLIFQKEFRELRAAFYYGNKAVSGGKSNALIIFEHLQSSSVQHIR